MEGPPPSQVRSVRRATARVGTAAARIFDDPFVERFESVWWHLAWVWLGVSSIPRERKEEGDESSCDASSTAFPTCLWEADCYARKYRI